MLCMHYYPKFKLETHKPQQNASIIVSRAKNPEYWHMRFLNQNNKNFM